MTWPKRLGLAGCLALSLACLVTLCSPLAHAQGFKGADFATSGKLGPGKCFQVVNSDGTVAQQWCPNGANASKITNGAGTTLDTVASGGGVTLYSATGFFKQTNDLTPTKGIKTYIGTGSNIWVMRDYSDSVTLASLNTDTGAWTATGTLSSNASAGANAIAANVTGARIDFGAGASDYATSDGTTVTFAGPVKVTNTVNSSDSKSMTVGAWTAHADDARATNTNFTGGFNATSVVAFRQITCAWHTLGVGGTTGVVVKITNTTDSTDLCTCTLGSCTATVDVPLNCDCNTAALAAKSYTVRYAATTDCVTNPAAIICNVEIAR